MALKPGPPVKASVVVKQFKKSQEPLLVGYSEDFAVPEGHTVVDVTELTVTPVGYSDYYGKGNQYFTGKDGKLFETVYSNVAPEFLKQKCFLLSSNYTWKLVKHGYYNILVPYKKETT